MLNELGAPGSAAIPVAAFRQHLRLGSGFADDGGQDGMLAACLRAAMAAVEARIGLALLARRFLWRLTRWSDVAGQVFPVAPVALVESVTLRDRLGAALAIDPAVWVLVPDGRRPRLRGVAGYLPPIPTVDLKRKEPIEYSKDIEPIFENKCFVCHSGSIVEAKFDMSTYAGVMKGGKRGVAVVPGKSAESNLFMFCSRQKKPIMPPKSEEPLTSQELSLLKLWVEEGAKMPTMARAKKKIVVDLPPIS